MVTVEVAAVRLPETRPDGVPYVFLTRARAGRYRMLQQPLGAALGSHSWATDRESEAVRVPLLPYTVAAGEVVQAALQLGALATGLGEPGDSLTMLYHVERLPAVGKVALWLGLAFLGGPSGG